MITLAANGDVGDVYLRELGKGDQRLRTCDRLAVDAGRRQKSRQGIRNLRIEIRGPVRYRQAVQHIGRVGIAGAIHPFRLAEVAYINRLRERTPPQMSL